MALTPGCLDTWARWRLPDGQPGKQCKHGGEEKHDLNTWTDKKNNLIVSVRVKQIKAIQHLIFTAFEIILLVSRESTLLLSCFTSHR